MEFVSPPLEPKEEVNLKTIEEASSPTRIIELAIVPLEVGE